MPKSRSRRQKIGIYPGTFDPITNGHMSLIHRAVGLFDNLIVAVAENAGKNPMFSHDERFRMVKQSLAVTHPDVKVIKFKGLLADLAKKQKASAIVRGLRAVSDFENEFQMALMNRKMARDIETVFLMPALSWVYLSSTVVKDVAANSGNINGLVPGPVAKTLYKKFKKA